MRSARSYHCLVSVVALAACSGAGADIPNAATNGSPEEVLADSLIGSWLDASGGMDAWHDIESARFTITTVWFDSTGRISRMRPRRVEMRKVAGVEQARIERPEAEGLYVQTWTGSDVWATLNDAPMPDSTREVGETEYVGRDVVYWFGLPYKLFDPGVNRRASSRDGGGYEVRVTFGDDVGAHPGDRYFYYFLDDDPYPEEVHYIEQGRTEEDRNRTIWEGFGRVGDFSYVVARRWLDREGMPTKELRIDDVTLNPTLSDSLFAVP
ncbi:MAG: hypothetical protein R3195_06815 [Gemmatimonadota bacterium]|nr:hypothetical protein [Gemmatimonadota bacterium]